ncbi:MAG: 2-oxo acid dehydrogenase subunit E2 [Candidatus Aenigmarchaeota archaeon]|nr:2-oxo acid dehydrogenase subunit E2 [Candidatus Aenigmarchaeota archaeon]
MALEFKFPDVGEGIAEGEIVKWRVKEGDEVKEHDVLVEIETDKAIVEIPSPAAGSVLKIFHKQGDTVKVGEALVSIGAKGESTPSIPAPVPSPAPVAAPVPIKKGPVIKPAGAVGYLEEAPDLEEAAGVSKPASVQTQMAPVAPSVLVTPAVRRLARDIGLDLSKIKGSGMGGRITEEDVRGFAKKAGMSEIKENLPQVQAKVQKKYDMYGYLERVPLKGVRKAIAEHMVESVSRIPHVTQMDEADVTLLYRHREREKRLAESKGVKLTYLPFIVKACVGSLKKYPMFNSTLDEEHNEIIMKKYYNIGIAVASENGLMVPVIKIADQKSLMAIAREIVQMAEKARSREVDLGDLKGGTFTITNVGSLGGIFATPIINYPEVAILAVGKMIDRLSVDKEGKIRVRKIMPLSLSFDHRVVDGADAAVFMNEIKAYLEDPDRIMMDE